MVEFALILPAFLLLSVMVFDLGRVIYYYSTIHNAAREGARYGIIHPNDFSGMINTASKYVIGLDPTQTVLTAAPGTPEPVNGFNNPTIKVTVSYTFRPATPLVANFLSGGTITLNSDAVMRTESLPSP